MISIPGEYGATCDGVSRREFLRLGGAGIVGVTLSDILRLQAAQSPDVGPAASAPKNGWGRAKSVIILYLQGGPSHIDIWDPKPDAPSNVRGDFKPIRSNVPGLFLSEVMPKLARQMDKATLIRSMSYTPVGLFNHTAAIYQIMTGYTPDRVSPSGQLEPPAPNDFPHFGSQISRLRPPEVPMLPFVMLPRALQESNVIGKGGTAGFLGAAYDPYYFYQDPAREINLADLTLRQEVSRERLEHRACLFGIASASLSEKKLLSRIKLNPNILTGAGRLNNSEKGTVCFVPHFSLMEMMTTIKLLDPSLAQRNWVTLYRPLDLSSAENWIKKSRERFGMKLVSRREGFGRTMEAVRQGGVACVLFDQNTHQGIPLKFLNRTCAVTNLPGIIAQRFQAEARIFWAHRTGFWRCELNAFALKTKDSGALTEESNAWLAEQLKSSDEVCADWLWAHNRWKSGDSF